jgi:hypothetical protein
MTNERDLREGTARINPETGEFYSTTSWAAVNLEPYKEGKQVIAPPRFLRRTDDRALIYPGRPHVFYGESESLKTWAALLACKSVADLGLRAVYVDLEGSAASFVERARMVGLSDAQLGTDVHYVAANTPLTGDAGIDFWHHELDVFGPALVVLDGVTELYALQGWDINKAEDAAKFQRTFAFHRSGVASISIDHTAKDAGRGQLGSQHKRAGLDGAEYRFDSLVAAGRGRYGMARVSVTKDRHGYVREWANDEVGKLVVDDAPDTRGAERCVYLEAPKLSDLINPKDDAMDRVLEFLRANPGKSKRQIRDGVPLQGTRVDSAVDALAALGKIANHGSPSKGAWHLP